MRELLHLFLPDIVWILSIWILRHLICTSPRLQGGKDHVIYIQWACLHWFLLRWWLELGVLDRLGLAIVLATSIVRLVHRHSWLLVTILSIKWGTRGSITSHRRSRSKDIMSCIWLIHLTLHVNWILTRLTKTSLVRLKSGLLSSI